MLNLPPEFTQTIINCYGPEAGEAWLSQLPAIVAGCEARWNLTVGPPVDNLSYNFIAPAQQNSGAEVILKIGPPNPELTGEIMALQFYNGRGSVKLLSAVAEADLLLLEKLVPGALLADVEDDEQATRIAAEVMQALWKPAPLEHTFKTAADWGAGLKRLRLRYQGGTGPFPPRLVLKAEALFAELLETADPPVLLHGDLHHWNILSAQRQPWLAIDPKGIIGEPAYETGAFLRNKVLDSSQPEKLTARRVAIFEEMLGFESERILAWALAQAVLSAWWCIEDNINCWQGAIRCAEIFEQLLD